VFNISLKKKKPVLVVPQLLFVFELSYKQSDARLLDLKSAILSKMTASFWLAIQWVHMLCCNFFFKIVSFTRVTALSSYMKV